MTSDHDPDDTGFTVDSARTAADSGELADWVHDFLASPGSDNRALGEQLRAGCGCWFGPVEIEFDRLHRLAGPPDQPTIDRLDDDGLDTVRSMEESLDGGWTPAPFVVTWNDDHFVLEDGNHRVEGLRRDGRDRYWCVVGADDEAARRRAEAALPD